MASSVSGAADQVVHAGHDLDARGADRVGLPGGGDGRTLVFGKRSDKMARKRLFIFTVLNLIGTGLAAFVTGHHTRWPVFFYATRFVAGMGIGGQYGAINSAIDEMMPSRYRGRSTSGSTGPTGPGRA
jgi:MFS family permease